jgi:hypothetical protein
MTMPPFPVDDQTLGLLERAMDPRSHGDADAQTSSMGSLLEFYSAMAGSDLDAVESEDDGIRMMRDSRYTDHCVIAALVAEVRRLRGALREANA